ncbi:hypothetical protein [Ruegeria arenilitoris]|uniref:hypothetical protein n=1 Tax=Ruegeria arenilitoris TaxID=1173585 RepID=UPI00147DEF60|nr:hypothetical protein [Ruegeria arenilitoris]
MTANKPNDARISGARPLLDKYKSRPNATKIYTNSDSQGRFEADRQDIPDWVSEESELERLRWENERLKRHTSSASPEPP